MATTEQEAALAVYEGVVQRATEDALVSSNWLGQSHSLLMQVQHESELASQAVALARVQYEAGRGDLFRLTEAQRQKLEVDQRLVQAQTSLNVYAVATMKALGHLPFVQ